jgi:hypothetical protein
VEADWAYLHPTLVPPPQYALTHRIAEEYPGYFDESLCKLLSAENPVVVAHVLEIIKLSKSKLAARLPTELFEDERTVVIAGCFIHSATIGQLARECRDQYSRSRSRPCH